MVAEKLNNVYLPTHCQWTAEWLSLCTVHLLTPMTDILFNSNYKNKIVI
jgi:hypothetical protein